MARAASKSSIGFMGWILVSTVAVNNDFRRFPRLPGSLTGMLLPALSKAKAKAQGILCMNNTKQLTLAWILCAGDHDDRHVPNHGIDETISRSHVRPFRAVQGFREPAERASSLRLTLRAQSRSGNAPGVRRQFRLSFSAEDNI